VDLCILSGSDYKFGKIAGIGIKKAFQLLNKFRSITRIIDSVASSKNWSTQMTKTYLDEYMYSKIAFEYHRVFDLKKCECVTIRECEDSGFVEIVHGQDDHVSIVGPHVPVEIAKQVMTGEIDAKTREKRMFLDKLPPGVLGVYNNSLRINDTGGVRDFDESLENREKFDSIEELIVSQFTRPVEDTEKRNRDYLESLTGMILGSTTPSVADMEFENIDHLLQLADDDVADDDEEEQDSIHTPIGDSPVTDKTGRSGVFLLGSKPPSSHEHHQPDKVKNPFAKKVTVTKSSFQGIRLATAAAHVVNPRPRADMGEITSYVDVLKRKSETSLEPTKRRQSLVTTRDIKSTNADPNIRRFFTRQ
jgi:hypothetical protein